MTALAPSRLRIALADLLRCPTCAQRPVVWRHPHFGWFGACHFCGDRRFGVEAILSTWGAPYTAATPLAVVNSPNAAEPHIPGASCALEDCDEANRPTSRYCSKKCQRKRAARAHRARQRAPRRRRAHSP